MASIWDEFKDLFKTNEQREREKKEKLNDARKREEDVVKQLEELEKQYNDSLPKEEAPDIDALFPKDSGYEELDYVVDSDDEIARKATEKANADKEVATKKLRDKLTGDVDSANSGRQKAMDDLLAELSGLEEEYDAREENAKDNALKNGVARGSVLSSEMDRLGGEKLAEGREAMTRYEGDIQKIDDKISSLEKAFDSAVEELDLKYAAQLKSDIEKLKKERDDEVAKYEKYNSGVRAKQAQYAREREEDIAEYLNKYEADKLEKQREQEEYERKYGYSGEKEKNYAARYDIAYEFYMSLDPKIAAEALEASPTMQHYLGYYYDRLLDDLRKRAGVKVYY